MLYKDVHILLKQFVNLLLRNNLNCPKAILDFIDTLSNSIQSGADITNDDKLGIERYLFPESGMGWLNDISYQLDIESKKELDLLLQKFYLLWKES